MTHTRRALIATAGAGASVGAAMLLYPGGTPLDRSTHHYIILQNFLSDLGMLVAYGGQPNTAGAVLFVASLALLFVAFAAPITAWVRYYRATRATRVLAGAAALAAVFVVVAFAGVAFVPEDRNMGLHVAFTFAGWRGFPILALLMTAAALRARDIPRARTAAGWGLLTIVLAVYVIILERGPSLATSNGLAVQTGAQKVVTLVTVIILLFQTHEADRVLSRVEIRQPHSTSV